ncbi:MAG: penicillin-binding protein 1C [Sphingomonadales bacterium]
MLSAILVAGAVWPSAPVPAFAEVRDGYQPSEAWLLDRRGRVIDVKRVNYGIRRLGWVPLDAVSPALRTAIVAGEDRRFWRHGGVDWAAAAGAVRDRLTGGPNRGGSTISMQVAAMLDPRLRPKGGGRGWGQKLAQMRAAFELERAWDKHQILEAYLNLLDFRGELQGIGATSRFLAGKHPSGLGARESLVLAALLPSPGAVVERVAARACARSGGADCAGLRETAERLLANARATRPPGLAPQLADSLLREAGERRRTTLDLDIQRRVVRALDRHLGGLTGRNVRDGAVLVVDNDTGDVLAYVASSGSRSRARQVDGVRAPRQAGSTLKPFLYGMALEKRYVTPASLLDDSPITLQTGIGLYVPQNYDRDFKGPVSVRTALASSLNVPAVRALVLVGVEPFRDRLHRMGYRGIDKDGEYYGFSLALGSAEVTLWEQVTAYRALARGGMLSPLRLEAGPADEGMRIMREDAAFLVADILGDRAARVTTFGLSNNLNTRFWSAVKTGTSKDMRDNWCIGWSRRYTVGVWVGNFEGDSMHGVSGVSGAAPVWHDVITGLDQGDAVGEPAPPAGVVAGQVRFEPAIENPRGEWFVDGTQVELMRAVPASNFARIVSPADGVVIALDPDIPAGNTRVPVRAEGADRSLSLKVDDRVLGRADNAYLWAPRPGTHTIMLQRSDGSVVDRAHVTVRDIKPVQK